MKKPYILFFILFLLVNSFYSFCGKWKENFITDIDSDKQLNHLDVIHRGLAYKVMRKTEEKPSQQKVSGAYKDVRYNNIGVCFYSATNLHHPPNSLRNPTNTTNYASSSIEYIYKKTNGKLRSHIIPMHDYGNYIFSSARSNLSSQASDHLLVKKNHIHPTIPDDYDKKIYEIYKPCAHSEDKIVYLFHNLWETFIEGAITEIKIAGDFSKLKGVLLHIHTRFDMCGSCEYALDWELENSNGVAQILKKYALGSVDCDDNLKVGAFVSSSQSHLVWGSPRRTLLEGPPTHHAISPETLLYKTRHDEFRKQESLEDIDAHKKCLKKVIHPFESSLITEIDKLIFTNSVNNSPYYIDIQNPS